MRTWTLLLPVLVILVTPAAEAGTPTETHPGITVAETNVIANDGATLRALITKPANAKHRLPAIYFAQWLSCDPVALSATATDGWTAMMRRIIRESGAIVWRTEKRGIGGSDGRCDTLDYETELADHRAAFAAMLQQPDIDRSRVVVFGGSMGATYAPLIAAGNQVAGVMVWGGGALTWAERTLIFERNALELGATAPESIAEEMTLRFRFLDKYLNDGLSPEAIAARDPALGKTWQRIVGTSANGHYGRPFAFHQQAQMQNWAAAWAKLDAPVLAMLGELDWFESRRGVDLIGRIVNRARPGTARVVIVPGLDHHFARYPSVDAAFREQGGSVDADAAVNVMLPWLRQRFRR